MTRLIALDVGDARIGVAVSDSMRFLRWLLPLSCKSTWMLWAVILRKRLYETTKRTRCHYSGATIGPADLWHCLLCMEHCYLHFSTRGCRWPGKGYSNSDSQG